MSTVRIWASVMEDGVVKVDVRDVEIPAGQSLPEATPEYRIWSWASIGKPGDELLSTDGCTCSDQRPCLLCQEVGVAWWREWQERQETFFWKASKVPDNFVGYSHRHWCDHQHKTELGAKRCAKKSDFDKLVKMNGLGKRLEIKVL